MREAESTVVLWPPHLFSPLWTEGKTIRNQSEFISYQVGNCQKLKNLTHQ